MLTGIQPTSFSLCLLLLLMAGCHKQDKDALPATLQAPKHWTVATLAGNGINGLADGPDSTASFNFPSWITANSRGDIFVTDVPNALIRKISDGQVTTYAGKGVSIPAQPFQYMYGLAVDADDNVYDIEQSFIRKIVSSNHSEVLAGNQSNGYKDSQGADARFQFIFKPVMAADGNIYVPDYDMNSRFVIRRITLSGAVSTILLKDNTGIPVNNSIGSNFLPSLVCDRAGNLYFTAGSGTILKKADLNGEVSFLAGSSATGFADGKAAAAQFSSIVNLVVDAEGNVFAVDQGNNAIREILPDGTVFTIAGKPGRGFRDGDGGSALFNCPMDIAIDGQGILYVADAYNYRIRTLQGR